MRVLDVCAGIGVVSYVAELLGMEIAGQIEIEPFCQAVLAMHWPHVKRLGDIQKVQGDEFGPVDLLAGGIPCQPFSEAGQQRGTADDRYLWPDTYRIIKTAKPRWVCIENVSGMVRLALDDILADLEREKYETQALLIPASAVGAPHQRERLFIVAHTNDQRCEWSQSSRRKTQQRIEYAGSTLADPNRNGQSQSCGHVSKERRWASDGSAESAGVGLADAGCAGLSLWQRATGEWTQPAVAGSVGRQVESRLGGMLDGVASWLDSFRWPAGPAEAQEEWEPPRTTSERVPNRAARLHALGNAIVPAVLLPIFAAILEADKGGAA